MEFTDRMQETKEQLEEHKALKFFKRALKRIRGDYPERQAREELRRYELGAWGRIREDLSKAVHDSRRLSVQVGDYGHKKFDFWPEYKDFTIVTVIDSNALSVELAKNVWKTASGDNAPRVDGVAFAIKTYDTIHEDDIYGAEMLLISSSEVVGKLDLNEEIIEMITTESLEELVGRVSEETSFAYRQSLS